ncbi:MAG: family glycosyltransferase [Planctomycetota bacterium]|nr:family glycosyltransferase [Planctomycetota bacterium]
MSEPRKPIRVWGLPLMPLTRRQAVDAAMALVERRKPSFFVTANTHYAMLTRDLAELREINARADFLLADGAPLVWASHLGGNPVPERVAGSDLIYDLSETAAARGYRLFLLGGPEGVADEAARRLVLKYPGLVIAGTACPPHRPPTSEEHEALLETIRRAAPDILFVAFGQPKGELWLAENLDRLGVPLAVQVGASIDFVAGRVRRAPRWIQKIGMEWAYRLSLEPRRLGPRYARNGLFLVSAVARDLADSLRSRRDRAASSPSPLPTSQGYSVPQATNTPS